VSTPVGGRDEGEEVGAGVGLVDDVDDAAVEPDEAGAGVEPVELDAEVDDNVVVLLELAASREACAATRFACATVTARSRSSVSIVASTSPDSTSSPTATFTDLTVPAVRKAAVTSSTRATAPDSETDWVTDPVATVAVRRPAVAAELGSAPTTR